MEIGDRVRLQEHESWRQPYRGWAEKKRMGTVTAVFTPHGSKREHARVKFDRSRVATRDEVFCSSDLIVDNPHR